MSKVLKLSNPIKFGSEEIKELTFREPKGKDMRSLPIPPNSGDLLDLAGKLCAQPNSVIDELSGPDVMKVLEIVGGFIQGGQQTGESV